MRPTPNAELNDVITTPRCPVCRAAYPIEGKGHDRHLVPNHKPWCRWRRATTGATTRTTTEKETA